MLTESDGLEQTASPEEPQEATPPVPEARRVLVEKLQKEIKADKKHHEPAFKRMREDRDFAYGRQWPGQKDPYSRDAYYVANIVAQHVNQRVAAIYAKNPRTVYRLRERLDTTLWDGSAAQIMQAAQTLMMPTDPMQMVESLQILTEAQQVIEQRKMLDKFGKSAQLFYEYQLSEQVHPFKSMMKLVVRRAVTTGVAYVKLGFQRVMEPSPDVERQIADVQRQMAVMERIAGDVQSGEITDEGDPQLERLRLMLQSLQEQPDVVVREGLTLDYPNATAIIPDRRCTYLREFLGCDRVSEEFVLTLDEVQEVYGVDLRKKAYTRYRVDDAGTAHEAKDSSSGEGETPEDDSLALVWVTYCKSDGLVYVTCDGYEDFLEEPRAPKVYTERFWPWFPVTFNEVDHDREIFPPSDVRRLMPMQREYNRQRQGLSEHRIASRPATVSAMGALNSADKATLQERPAFAHLEIQGLQPGQKVGDLIQRLETPNIDPNLYEVNPTFEDVLRTVGSQEANLGGAHGNTATETSIAEGSRLSAVDSNIDDLDMFLTALARAGGQIIMAEIAPETVKEVIGPGAVWPEQVTRQELAQEIYLEIEAGSTGRPNQAQEIQNFERMFPLLAQIPGIAMEPLAKEAIRRLDDKLQLEDFLDPNMPSLQALNQMVGGAGGSGAMGAGPEDPAGQGPEGADNAQRPDRQPGSNQSVPTAPGEMPNSPQPGGRVM